MLQSWHARRIVCMSLVVLGAWLCPGMLAVSAAAMAQTEEAEEAAEREAADHEAAEHDAAAHEAADHGGAHHDPTDLSHANASDSLSSPADMRFDLSIYTFIVFLLLLATLYKFAWGPISKGLEKREQGIAQKIAEAHEAAAAAEARLRDYEAKLAEATNEAKAIISKAHVDAQRASERIIAEAQEKATREQQRAVADIEVAKNTALESISQRSVSLALSLAGRIVRKELNEADHAQLIRDALDKLPSSN